MKKIYEFNQKAGLLDDGYNDQLEASMQIEEALEGFDDSFDNLAFELQLDKNYPSDADEVCHARHLARYIASLVKIDEPLSDVQRFDKALDALFLAAGSIYKLGLTPVQLSKGLDIVCNANLTKLSAGKDSHGKQIKPDGFVNPEPLLQLILDERK